MIYGNLINNWNKSCAKSVTLTKYFKFDTSYNFIVRSKTDDSYYTQWIEAPNKEHKLKVSIQIQDTMNYEREHWMHYQRMLELISEKEKRNLIMKV